MPHRSTPPSMRWKNRLSIYEPSLFQKLRNGNGATDRRSSSAVPMFVPTANLINRRLAQALQRFNGYSVFQDRTPPKTVNGAVRQKQSGSANPASASRSNSVASGG